MYDIRSDLSGKCAPGPRFNPIDACVLTVKADASDNKNRWGRIPDKIVIMLPSTGTKSMLYYANVY